MCGRAVPAGFAAPAPDAGVAPPGVIAPADWLDEPASSHLTWSSSHTEEAAAEEEGGGGRGGRGDEAMEEDTEGEEVLGDCSREERERPSTTLTPAGGMAASKCRGCAAGC